ncbi:MAG: hypothetical protein IPM42_20270 [Saprospiraceae bacterium]|nr:hypothetical protein [Saprospiraceae bacterium]
MNYEVVIAQKDAEIALKDTEIRQQTARIEELAHQIAQLQNCSMAANPNVSYPKWMLHN